jgi:anti-anti-sigma factor
MTIRSQAAGGTAVLSMAGSMGPREFCELHDRLVSLLQRRQKRIVLDFGGVDHVSYRDASRLAGERDLVRSYNGELTVAGLNAYVRDILLFAGLSGLLESSAHGETPRGSEPAHELRAS